MTTSIKYRPQLDGLRFLAVSGVLVFHFANRAGVFLSSGSYGVNLFFVLSGFLITTLLLNEREQSYGKAYGKFIARRALRIFPIYYLSILIMVIAGTAHILERLPWLLTYTYNFILPAIDWGKEYFGHFWSLSVEEQFYLFYPLLVLCLRKKPGVLMLVLYGLVVLALAQVFFDIWGFSGYYKNLYAFNYTSLLTNMAPLSIGSIAAILVSEGASSRFLQSRIIEFIVILLIVLVCTCCPWNYQLLLFSLLNVVLVVKAYQSQFRIGCLRSILSNKRIVYLGKISYGIYIYHLIMGRYMDEYVFNPLWNRIPFPDYGTVLTKLGSNPWLIRLPLYTMISILLAHLSYQIIERPVLRVKVKYLS